ncbi:hypothetical protein LWI28_005175 [Acer negundo]|uniref:Retrotransposon gag domain-containing protein n=1 Tax=Acer negundo TaxID=4023 RepID=A0AAD5NWF0_ACENE|nr:hypothetical protein LWI28_005175 [Acer negundo]
MVQSFPNYFRRPYIHVVPPTPKGCVDSFQQFNEMFIRHFAGNVQHKKLLMYLSSLSQDTGETIKSYINRFIKEAMGVEDFNDIATITSFTNGLQSSQIYFHLRQTMTRSYEELLEITADYAWVEEEKVA